MKDPFKPLHLSFVLRWWRVLVLWTLEAFANFEIILPNVPNSLHTCFWRTYLWISDASPVVVQLSSAASCLRFHTHDCASKRFSPPPGLGLASRHLGSSVRASVAEWTTSCTKHKCTMRTRRRYHCFLASCDACPLALGEAVGWQGSGVARNRDRQNIRKHQPPQTHSAPSQNLLFSSLSGHFPFQRRVAYSRATGRN